MGKKIFVTGGSGFVGTHLVNRLLREGYRVTCFTKHKAKITPKARRVVGSIENEISDKVLRGNDLVIHAASEVKSPKWSINYNSNVLGTKNILEACKRNKVKKIIYLSTINTQLRERRAYGETKRIAEDLIIKSGLKYIIIRPAMIYGKGDHSIAKTIRLVRQFPFVPILGDGQGIMQPVYIEDVIATISKCIKLNRYGKIYTLVSSRSITFDEYIDMLLKAVNVKKPKVHIPIIFVKIVAYVCEKMNDIYPVITLEQVYTINQKEKFGIKRERKELGYDPVDLNVGIIKRIL